MLDITSIRRTPGTILVLGGQVPNIQAILDFDFISGKSAASVIGIVSTAGHYQKYFWGKREILIPCYESIAVAATALGEADWMFNMLSGRRALQGTHEFFSAFPAARGGHIFAEDVPEIHALELITSYGNTKMLIGPSGVGLMVPGALKLGVIGGVDWQQLQANNLNTAGDIAVLSASGGMVNELISMVTRHRHGVSFAVCFGGDRFPIMPPREALLAAQADPLTKAVVYYGELGGDDEYRIAELLQTGQFTKPFICYIAGVVGEGFNQSIQFGHAKALASNRTETASAKRQALLHVGALVANSIAALSEQLASLPTKKQPRRTHTDLSSRGTSLFSSTIGSETADGYVFGGLLLQDWASKGSISLQIATGLLGHAPKSELTTEFIETVFLLSADHGAQVSGAVVTNITARAGKDMASAVAAGLLTIGPRFGGAVSAAAKEWVEGVACSRNPSEHVEARAKAKKYISGIGHKKYRLDTPDPRVGVLANFTNRLEKHDHYDYARAIEAVTTTKKGSLILNVDGIIAAVLLDILVSVEGYDTDRLRSMIDMDFFNALFIIPRVVGLASHYLDQRRLDEGLFRLPDDGVFYINP